MIVGLGTDLIAVGRMGRLRQRFGRRLEEKLLGDAERGDFIDVTRPDAFLARRFAAKEATVKALGTGFQGGIRWVDIQVGHDPLGRPELHLAGAAAQRLAQLARRPRLWLSISDEHRYALATVVIEDEDQAV